VFDRASYDTGSLVVYGPVMIYAGVEEWTMCQETTCRNIGTRFSLTGASVCYMAREAAETCVHVGVGLAVLRPCVLRIYDETS
jgi:hypothetical protein